jgi:3-isopropylmalate dehydrogenase
MRDGAEVIENACRAVLEDGLRTTDIMQPGKTRVTTQEMGAAVMRELERLAA